MDHFVLIADNKMPGIFIYGIPGVFLVFLIGTFEQNHLAGVLIP